MKHQGKFTKSWQERAQLKTVRAIKQELFIINLMAFGMTS